jgi:hypothetical protein
MARSKQTFRHWTAHAAKANPTELLCGIRHLVIPG